MMLYTLPRLLVVTCTMLICLAIGSCSKQDIQKSARVYFTYEVGYNQITTQPNGDRTEEFVPGDGMCAFEVQDAGWRPSGSMPEGQGFGYMALNSHLKPQMVIYMPFMAVGTYQKHYADGTADIPGEWKLAAKLLTGVGLTDSYTVSMGSYSVGVGEEDGYEVLVVSL